MQESRALFVMITTAFLTHMQTFADRSPLPNYGRSFIFA